MAEPSSHHAWRLLLKRRLTIAAVAFVLWGAAIEARLVYLQVVAHADLKARAERQQQRTIALAPKRGDIVDRFGTVLAYSVDARSVYVVPNEIVDPARTVGQVCSALGDCSSDEREAWLARIARGRHFAYLRRQASVEQAERIAALKLPGVGFITEDQRRYPNRELASHVIGYVGIDNEGLGGTEATYDPSIKGKSGSLVVVTDAAHNAFSREERPPTAGASLELTIDHTLQYIAERELKAGVEWAGASGGSVVVMDPRTGEILAMANYPTFNPNRFQDAPPRARRNRAVQDLYDPGSTFKIVTASALFEEGVVRSTDMFNVSSGTIRFGSRVIRDDHRYGSLSFRDVIVKSSNVGTIQAVSRLGDTRAERLMRWVNAFGFGSSLSPDFPGENKGIVWSAKNLNDSALASVAIGYQISVTPLQMVTAASAVANGGELMEPRVVRAVIRDGKRAAVRHKVLRRTISPATAAELTRIMEGVVEEGTGKSAQIPGYTVAGKTGTAQKVVNGAYSRSEYNVSFVGFVPSRDPVFAIAVVIDSPHAVSAYGGTVSAPIFQRIAAASLRQYGVQRSIDPAPPVLVAANESGEPRDQPASGPLTRPAIVTAGTSGIDAGIPDLSGMSARRAVRALSQLGLTATLIGKGVVVNQRPASGTPIDTGAIATIWLGRPRSDEDAVASTP